MHIYKHGQNVFINENNTRVIYVYPLYLKKLRDQKLTHVLGHEIFDAKKCNALRRYKL
jgi:hypothetical protein